MTQKHQTEKQINDQHIRFNPAKELLLCGDLDADDYRSIKQETESRIATLRQILTDITISLEAIELKIKKIENAMFDLSNVYQKASVAQNVN